MQKGDNILKSAELKTVEALLIHPGERMMVRPCIQVAEEELTIYLLSGHVTLKKRAHHTLRSTTLVLEIVLCAFVTCNSSSPYKLICILINGLHLSDTKYSEILSNGDGSFLSNGKCSVVRVRPDVFGHDAQIC